MEVYKRGASGSSEGEVMVISNSESIAEGGFIYQGATGFALEMDAVANPVLGLAVGFRDGDKIPFGSGFESTDYTSFTKSRLGNILAASSDNQTVEGAVVQYFPVKADDIFYGELDATVATTTGSGTPGYYISVLTTDATKLDESTASTSQQHFKLVDNGKGENSAVHPTLGGNFVLFKVTEIQDLQTQA